MRKNSLIFSLIIGLFIFLGCSEKKSTEVVEENIVSSVSIGDIEISKAIDALIEKYGDENKFRIERGVNQVATLWRDKDGTITEFITFCESSFINEDEKLDKLFNRLSQNYEILNGHFNKISLDLKQPLHLDMGEILDVDMLFGGFDPSAHMVEDLYTNKIAMITALNFPYYSLTEKTTEGANWTRKQWAYARMGDMFTSRVPAELIQNVSEVSTNADTYISEYNIYMGKLVNDNMETLFPEDLRLITHWGLRDELKSNYTTENGLVKQKMIYSVMKNIITQNIPQEVINKNENLWNPINNKLYKEDKEVEFKSEENTRYQHMLNLFNAMREIDEFSPQAPTYIQRKFEGDMEIPQEDVENLFKNLVSSSTVKDVAELIKKRLGRDLEPFDIWYNGFGAGTSMSEEDLDIITQKKYPTTDAFHSDLANILVKLQFDSTRAESITSKIAVDDARGAGHAWGAEMKSEKAHLRTRLSDEGMDYKGYNIAIHEFGHNVEQTITLQDVDHYMLRGVPNTAFTEAIAFIFQKRDLELLGLEEKDPNKRHLMALDNFWGCYEIMGVSLVDMEVWKWLYANPNATSQELNQAVNKIAIDVWNKYYAEVFGIKDQPILAVYSHMIDAPLYLSAYPIGLLIDFQLEEQIQGKVFSEEIEKVLLNGRIIPQQWMRDAVGKELSNEPLIKATDKAVKALN